MEAARRWRHRLSTGGKRVGKFVAVSTVGFALLALGVALLFLPGPGLAVIAAGLAVLAIEYRWARRTLAWLKARFRDVARRAGLRRFENVVQAPTADTATIDDRADDGRGRTTAA